MTADGFYHCSVKSVGRGNGASIVAKSAYRAGVRIEDERTGDVADYRARGGVAETFTVARDGVTPPDIGKLWNDAERAEVRTNGRLATETVIAFPQEFDAATRRKLGEEFARSIVGKHGIVAQVSIHAPDREGDARNWHAHILFSHREFGPDGFGDIANTRTMTRKRKGREVQEQIAGIAATPADIKTIRKEWEQTVNREYERQGLDIRIDHRSHKDRGLDQEPTKHLGPTASQMERDEPGLSDRAAVNREITQRNAARILAAMREAEVSQIKAEIIDLKADLAMQESRDAAQGRTDDVRPVFTAAAARTTEPAAEIFDRDAANRAADDRIVDAAIANAEAQKARQQPGADAGRETRGGEVDPSGGPEAERAAEREQARPASRIESRIADCAEKAARLGATVLEDASGRRVDRVEALADYFRPDDERQTHAVTVHGREAFAARLEDVGIALVRVTETDAKALAALREQEEFDRASGLAHKPRHFANLVVGDLAAVTHNGDVHRINPDKFSDAKRFLDLAADLPGVVETRARFEIEGEKIAALWDQQRTAGAEVRQDFAAERENQTQHAQTVREVGQFNREIGEAVDTGFKATGSFLGSLGKIFESFVGWLADSIAPLPPPTFDQAERMARSAEEKQEARAQQEAQAEREAQHWLIIEAQQQAAREREEAQNEQENARRREQDRGYEREI